MCHNICLYAELKAHLITIIYSASYVEIHGNFSFHIIYESYLPLTKIYEMDRRPDTHARLRHDLLLSRRVGMEVVTT